MTAHPFEEHSGDCSPAHPCSHCVGMQWLRNKLGSEQFEQMLQIFSGQVSHDNTILQPQSEEDEIEIALREAGMAKTGVTQILTNMRVNKLCGWSGFEGVITGRTYIANFSEKSSEIGRQVLENRISAPA